MTRRAPCRIAIRWAPHFEMALETLPAPIARAYALAMAEGSRSLSLGDAEHL